MQNELILHHYDPSPFSEKVRLVLGLKRLAWRSVIVPMVLPKPDLMPLTGGNRRTPVLQIGADVYCGTNLIAAELERRFPEPTIYPGGSRGLCAMLGLWADQILFLPSSRYAIRDSSHFPPSFYEDRAAMRGHATVSDERLRAEARHNLEQLQVQLAYVEQTLADMPRFCLAGSPRLPTSQSMLEFGGRSCSAGIRASLPRCLEWPAGRGVSRRSDTACDRSWHRKRRSPSPLPPSRGRWPAQPPRRESVSASQWRPRTSGPIQSKARSSRSRRRPSLCAATICEWVRWSSTCQGRVMRIQLSASTPNASRRPWIGGK